MAGITLLKAWLFDNWPLKSLVELGFYSLFAEKEKDILTLTVIYSFLFYYTYCNFYTSLFANLMAIF